MNDKSIEAYLSNLEENVFLLMQQLDQQYDAIMAMPVKRFSNCLKWKVKFDEQVQKIQNEQMNKL